MRLFWAGVQIESEGATLVIDLLEHAAPIRSLMGDPRLPIVFGSESLEFELVIHLHPDHYDPNTLRRKLRSDAKVLCHPANASKIARDGFTVVGITLYEPISVGPFKVTALPAVDGLGDPQVSFLVEAEDTKLMHFGNTLWHGHWWKIRARCGPPDVAFLPINGAITQFPNMKPSGIPADLMPNQAAAAAAIL
jgi:L-ascorbate metabolism protein UlaG (beta-lactamase superfamily)